MKLNFLLKDKLIKFFNNKNVKYGLPFISLMILGSFGLREFTQLRYTYNKKNLLKPEEVEKHGISMKKPGEVTLETEYDKIAKLDLENWKNIRGPRPWEPETIAANKN